MRGIAKPRVITKEKAMSLRSLRSASNVRFGNLGVFSVAVIAFALATLQGCTPSAVTTSSGKEFSAPVADLGRMGRDNPPAAAERQPAERNVQERSPSRSVEPRFFRMENCRRCGGS